MSIKNSNDTIGNRTRDLPACSAVPQPTAPPAACPHNYIHSVALKVTGGMLLRNAGTNLRSYTVLTNLRSYTVLTKLLTAVSTRVKSVEYDLQMWRRCHVYNF